jgi:hypothetical protein
MITINPRGRSMHPQKKAMFVINVLGGAAVIGSYIYGLSAHPGTGDALWGATPNQVRTFYAMSMVLAALGYLAFTYFLLLRADPTMARVAKRPGLGLFNWLYVGILVPSALWMPLTWMNIAQSSEGLWFGIRAILVAVGLASIGLMTALVRFRPKVPAWAYRLAVLGSVVFTLHTAVLDALVWPVLFRG